ncbi:MAG TPA: SgcJ/EcaC family oxidoreductase [Methylophilaceae bacterium]|nr:SgcJ/EcaC family oxidoreductase [Methylophilaceae bacterium]
MQDFSTIIASANEAWNAAFNSGDTERLAALYADNAVLSPGNGQVLVGRAAIANLFKTFIDAGVVEHTLETVEVNGDENALFQVARWSAKGAATDGARTEFGGITLNVMKRDASGNWLTQAHVWNAGQ